MSAISRRTFLGSASAMMAASGLAACSDDSGTPSSQTPSPSPPASSSYRMHRDLSYASPVGRGHLLDLYVPTTGEGPFPVVILQTGSAWLSDDSKGPIPGTESDASTSVDGAPNGLGGVTAAGRLAELWAPHGYAIVGVNVRSSGQARFPAQVHDIKAAIRYLRAEAGTYQLDADHFATMGTSSGAWVSTMAGATSGLASFEGDLGHAGQSSAVQAVIDLFGPTDFTRMDAHRLPDGQQHDLADSPESLLMGFPIQTDRAAVEKANPATYVTSTSPPVYISHGMVDPLVPYNQSQILFAAYEKAGAAASLTLVPKADHTDRYLASAADSAGRTVAKTNGGRTTTGTDPAPTYTTLLSFLDDHLRP